MAKVKDVELNKRFKQIRIDLGLSMESFGEKIGISKQSVYKIECFENNPSEQTLKLICSEFNVDPFWLETGEGDMFTAMPETVIDELVEQYKLSYDDKIVIETYSESPPDQRDVIKNFLLTLAENLQKKGGN